VKKRLLIASTLASTLAAGAGALRRRRSGAPGDPSADAATEALRTRMEQARAELLRR
jgi:hypothetical protein